MNKLGWFNVTNPLEIDQYFDLNLAVPEEQRMAEVLTALAVAEPVSRRRFLWLLCEVPHRPMRSSFDAEQGNNFLDPLFARRPELPYIPGWELPANWVENYVGKCGRAGVRARTLYCTVYNSLSPRAALLYEQGTFRRAFPLKDI